MALERRSDRQIGAALGGGVDRRGEPHHARADLCGLVHHINPPSNIETIDPKTLHLSGEFTEANLGTRVSADGQVTSRIVATQFTFQPRCLVLPANRPVTLRFATPGRDSRHPGHRNQRQHHDRAGLRQPGAHRLHATGELLMPCHEYCGLGHSQMFAKVRVVPPEEFQPDAQGRVSCDAR